MKENRNAGFTLVEIMIAMLMMLIIITSVGQFMSASSINYQAVDNQVNMQMEAQNTINTICDMVLEANNVAYEKIDGEEYFFIYKNLGEPDSKGNPLTKANALQNVIWLDKTNYNLYLFVCNNAVERLDAIDKGKHTKKKLLAEGVANWSFSTATGAATVALTEKGLKSEAFSNNPTLTITVDFQAQVGIGGKKDGYTYSATDSVSPRSQIVEIA